MLVSELTTEQVGWVVRVPDPDPIIRHREFALDEVRHLPDGRVWLLDTDASGPGWVGTLRTYDGDTPCEVLRQTKKRRRVRR